MKYQRKNFILFLFLILLGLTPIKIYANNNSLQVGMELSYPPFETISPSGRPEGISVDIANALGNFLQKKIFIENIPFIGLIPALKTGKIDLIISSMTVTQERKAAIDFSDPYLTTGLCLLVSRKSNIRNIADANHPDRRIVVKSGTSGEIYAKKHLNAALILVLDKESSCVLEVVQGKADAFIYDQFSVFTNWKKNPDSTYALLEPFQKEHWAIGIRKGDQEMVSQVNAFLKKFRSEGGFENLGDKYLSEEKEAFKKKGIPFVF